jgi:DNA repair exonuclease SbcCD ATPase subunit
LYLDEFGKTFDPEHRERAYNAINNILVNNYSNIFLISHFDSLHGRFVNADVNILNSDNLDISIFDRYNDCMEIIRA